MHHQAIENASRLSLLSAMDDELRPLRKAAAEADERWQAYVATAVFQEMTETRQTREATLYAAREAAEFALTEALLRWQRAEKLACGVGYSGAWRV